MRLIVQLALVSETPAVSFAEVAKVSAALQKQAARDLERYWDVSATVDAFAVLEDVPPGYWPIIVRDDIGQPGAAGIHLDKDGQPFALVSAGPRWSLTASHEAVEMLVDPFGNRLVPGDSPKRGQGRVEFLVEVADPSEDAEFAYTVNGVLVSDFYTPRYFDPVRADGVQYSFTGAIKAPRQVLRGGYLSWHDPVSDHWFQQTFFAGTRPRIDDIGIIQSAAGGIRARIDQLTEARRKTLGRAARGTAARRGGKGAALKGAALTAAAARGGSRAPPAVEPGVAGASTAKAASWKAQIGTLLGGG